MAEQSGRRSMAVALLAACLALLIQIQASSAAVSHTVGDSTGWTLPPSPTYYNTWASKQSSFSVGDYLVFNFAGASETVAEVTKSAYDSCSAVNPITQMNNGPVNLTITSPGTHYYISTDSGHCSAGQKLAVTAASTTAPSPGATTPSGAMSPAASTPTATPAGKGSMAPSTTPSTGVMTPATSPAGKGGAMAPSTTPITPAPSGAMTPATSPMASPGSTSMSPAGAPSSTSETPVTSPTAAASAPESDSPMGAPMASDLTPSAGGPGVSSSPAAASAGGGMMESPAMSPAEKGKDNSASVASPALMLPLLLLVGSYFLF